jgi:ABC-2 type transport system ATP-binding protein
VTPAPTHLPARRPAATRHATTIVAAAVLLLGSAACSDDDTGGDGDGDRAAADAAAERSCDQGATGDGGAVTPVEGVAGDLTVTSFDGTEIRIHWFPTDTPDEAGEPSPTILMGPGWSQAGDTTQEGAPLFGAMGIGPMNDAGYNVLTWDPRGFGESTGAASVNAADAEGRDVQVILDWVSEQSEALLDDDGDPRVGMVGASYGGGIQLTVAGIDCRVDALVPSLAWHSLETSLYKGETVKAGWSSTLADVASAGTLDPHITSAAASGPSTGLLSAEDLEWFRDRGPAELVDAVTAPTLFVHGTVDTLFTLDEAITNHRSLRDRDVPTGMLWFCGGHGACITDEPDLAWITDATFAWLDRYVKDDDTVGTGPTVVVVDQDGQRWSTGDYPDAPDDVLAATAEPIGAAATLALSADSQAGPLAPGSSTDLLSGLVQPITPAPAGTAVEAEITADDDGALLVGAPRLRLDYQGDTPDGPEPVRVFAQLVDEAGGTVVGNQITPVPLVLDGEPQSVEVDLEVIAHRLAAGETLTLQLVATTVAYATPRLGGTVTFSSIEVDLPVATGFTAVD